MGFWTDMANMGLMNLTDAIAQDNWDEERFKR